MKIRALLAAVLMLLTVSGTALAEIPLTEYRVRELEMTIELPTEAYVTGRNVDAGFPLLETYGMTAEQLEKNYSDRDIYYNAVWYDDDAEVTEIVVAMTENHDTLSMYDLSVAEQYQLKWIEELYLNYDSKNQSGARYYDVSLVKCGGVNFFRAKGSVEAEKRRNILEYMTIVNGRRIEVTMIEYLPAGDDTEETRMTVSTDHERLMDAIMQTIEFDEIKSVFMARYGGILRTVAFAGAVGIFLLVYFAVRNRRSHKESLPEAELQLAEAEQREEISVAEEEETALPESDLPPEAAAADESGEPAIEPESEAAKEEKAENALPPTEEESKE